MHLINTQWQGAEDPKVVNAGDHVDATERRVSEEESPRAAIIGRK